MAKLKKKQKMMLKEGYHYLLGTLIILLGGYFLAEHLGLINWVFQDGILGWAGITLYLYVLTIYIIVDQLMHKLFGL